MKFNCFPEGQYSQEAASVVVEYIPFSHGLHEGGEEVEEGTACWPGWQLSHVCSSKFNSFPGGQYSQEVASMVVEYFPFSHGSHEGGEEEEEGEEKYPGWQLVQDEAPACFPGGQYAQD